MAAALDTSRADTPCANYIVLCWSRSRAGVRWFLKGLGIVCEELMDWILGWRKRERKESAEAQTVARLGW
jgi:hypothetical protein